MSYITYNTNQVVYIKQIGYGTLIQCGKFKSISIKNDAIVQKKESIIFDPDMFNTDLETLQHQNKQVVIHKQQNQIQHSQSQKLHPKQQLINKQPNIVILKLQNTQVLVYTLDINIKKSITLIIKPILINRLNSIVVDIDINKSLESLKKIVFDKLDEPITSYNNICFYTTSPILTQLNVWSKTILQCNIKDGQRLILQAYYAFGFKDIVQKNKQLIVLSNNSNTITRSIPKPPPIINEKPIEQPKKIQQTQNNQPKAQQLPKIIALPNIQQIMKPAQQIKQIPKNQQQIQIPQKNIEKIIQIKKEQIIDKEVQNILDVQKIIEIPVHYNELEYHQQNLEVVFEVKNPKEINQILLQQNNLNNVEGFLDIVQLEAQKAAQIAKQMQPNNIAKQANQFIDNKIPLPKGGIFNQKPKIVRPVQPLDEKIQQKIMKKIKQIEKVDKVLQKQTQVQSKQKLLKKQPSINNIIFCPCRIQLYSGRHYWQFKIDKAITQNDIWIGVMNQEKNLILAYLPLCGRKYQNNQFIEYGFICKQTDIIGVLLSFDRYGKSNITFYKNTINCGQLDLEIQSPITPMVGLGGESQITIDSKAQYPIESYRHLK